MIQLRFFSFLIAIITLISCKEDNKATSKIKSQSLQNAALRDAEIKKGTASISFDKKVYDFGVVNEGDIVKTTFELTNSGKTDLVITNAQGSCGCTVPTWPKEPIKPGKIAKIDVRFNTTGKPNKQRKTVTLTTNTESGREVLTLKGSVIPKEK